MLYIESKYLMMSEKQNSKHYLKHIAMTHKCPVDNCDKQIPSHILMCSPHWQQVPPSLQRQVYAHWHRGNPIGEYLDVRAEAIRSVNLFNGTGNEES